MERQDKGYIKNDQGGRLWNRDDGRLTPAQSAAAPAYRKTHAALYQKFSTGAISPRDLRVALVKFYADEGQQKLDARFFTK